MLFNGITQLPGRDVMGKLMVLLNKKEEVKNKSWREFLSKALMQRYNKENIKRGMSVKESEKEIEKMAEHNRILELKKIEEGFKNI